jgi:hypothetical protein
MAFAVYYLFDPTTKLVLYALDCEESSKAGISVEWTKYPIEKGANISDFGYVNPEMFEMEGVVTAYPINGGYDLPGVLRADAALAALAKKKQPLTMVTKYWAPSVVLDNVERTDDGSVGSALRVKIKGHPVEIPKITYTQIPPKQMKRPVKRRAAPKKKGGKGSKTPLDRAADRKAKQILAGIPWVS